MTKNNTEKIHASSNPETEQKVLPPSSMGKDIFSSKRHSMNYVTADGVKLRTGYDSIIDWYILVLKELLDNAVDFLWKRYQGTSDAAIDVYIEKTSNSRLRIKIRNTNHKDLPSFTLENIKLIFNFDMTYGSKQNVWIINRGVLGDAMKQILALSYVLIHTNDDGNSFTNRQWEYPLIIRSNGKEFQTYLYVDLAGQRILPDTKENPDAKVSSTDTEIEVILPIIDEVKRWLDIHPIEQYCKEYPIFTTDISFKFKLVDHSPDTDKPVEDNAVVFDAAKKEWVSKVAEAITAPARKAAIKIEYPALHPIAEKWNNRSSIHYYKKGEFMAFLENVHDKANITVYERIQQLREGNNLKMTPDNTMSIADLVADTKNKDKIEEKLYYQLRGVLSAPDKLSLPYASGGEKRKEALVKRIARLHDGRLDTKKAVYKTAEEFHDDGIVAFPYFFEIIAIPYNDKSIQSNESWVQSEWKGSVNYSISPRPNIFEGHYKWDDPRKTNDFSSPYALTAPGILEVYNFHYYKKSEANAKLPCVIFANLITPRVDYHGTDKSRIHTDPFIKGIIKASRRIADNIKTFRAANYYFPTKSSRIFTPVRDKKRTIEDVMTELLRTWM